MIHEKQFYLAKKQIITTKRNHSLANSLNIWCPDYIKPSTSQHKSITQVICQKWYISRTNSRVQWQFLEGKFRILLSIMSNTRAIYGFDPTNLLHQTIANLVIKRNRPTQHGQERKDPNQNIKLGIGLLDFNVQKRITSKIDK